MIEVCQHQEIPYQEALDLQNQWVSERSQSAIPDRLFLLQHPHTYTLGSAGNDDNIVWSPEKRAEMDVAVFHVDRGGDVTYHGPGQLVGYPIIQLPRASEAGLRADVVGYVRNIERVIIRTLADYGITGKPIRKLTGVWVDTPQGEAKVCAIGVKINVKAVTKHGFALNINTDMHYFEGIVPCGIADKGVTSMAQLLGAPVDEDEVARRLIKHFGAVFGAKMRQMS